MTLTDADFSAQEAKDALNLHQSTLNTLIFQARYIMFTRGADGMPILDFPTWK